MKRFFKVTWVFFVAVAAVVAGAALLLVGINAAHAAEKNVTVQVDTPAVSLSTTYAEQEAGADDAFVMPDVLMTYTDTGVQAGLQDIKAEQAIETAIRMVTRVFGADLDGEVGRLAYNKQSGGITTGRGRWYVTFGSETAGSYLYQVQIDSISGLVQYMSGDPYVYPEDTLKGSLSEEAFKEFQETYEADALSIAEEYFAKGRDILEVSNDRSGSYAEQGAEPAYLAEDYIYIFVTLEDGATLEFAYVIGLGGLEAITYTPSPSALLAVDPTPTPALAQEAATEEPAVEAPPAAEEYAQ